MDQLPEAIKDERLQRLQRDIAARQAAFLASQQGVTFDVLFEKSGRYPGQIVGRSPYLQPVQVMGPTSLIGEIASVTVTEVSANSLFGALAGSLVSSLAKAPARADHPQTEAAQIEAAGA
jgi:tRNA-2-methylthio-N6-dimethylallyladenosine synthase